LFGSLLVVVALGAPEPCRVDGLGEAWSVTVAPEGAAPFVVALGGMRVEVALRASDAVVRGVSPLAFEARAAVRDVPLGVARAGWVTPHVHASTATWLAPRALVERGVEVDIDVPDARLEPIVLPCARLALRGAARAPIEPSHGLVELEGAVLSLQAAPDRGAIYTVVFAEPGGIGLHELARRSGWVRVEASWSDDTRVRGWTPSDGLGRVSLARMSGAWGEGVGCRLRRTRMLPVGTAIHARPGGPRWATVTTPLAVELDRSGPGWARVVRMSGVASPERCGEIAPIAWVLNR